MSGIDRRMVEAMTADQLQRVFRTFSDPTRVRILALLEREELAVQEIMAVAASAHQDFGHRTVAPYDD